MSITNPNDADDLPGAPTPRSRAGQSLLLADAARAQVQLALDKGVMDGGWLLTGPPMVGKATLAFAIAATVLCNATALGESDTTTRSLIANGGHPDLFVLERTINQKTGALRAEIPVDDVRAVSAGLHQTSTTGRRVVIVDLADHMGRGAANALLKTLEEPPRGTVLLLLSAAPGRLLPTVKSRCRRINFAPLPSERLSTWLVQEQGIAESKAAEVAADSGGRPGAALHLIDGTGSRARVLADGFWAFLTRTAADPSMARLAQSFARTDADGTVGAAHQLILGDLDTAVRANAAGDEPARVQFGNAELGKILHARDRVAELSSKGLALNADRQHTILSMAFALEPIIERARPQ